MKLWSSSRTRPSGKRISCSCTHSRRNSLCTVRLTASWSATGSATAMVRLASGQYGVGRPARTTLP